VPRFGYVLRKWVRKHRLALLIIAGIIVIIVAAVGVDAVRVRHDRNTIAKTNHELNLAVDQLREQQQRLSLQAQALEQQLRKALSHRPTPYQQINKGLPQDHSIWMLWQGCKDWDSPRAQQTWDSALTIRMTHRHSPS